VAWLRTGFSTDASGQKSRNKISRTIRRCFLMRAAAFLSHFPGALNRTMKTETDFEKCCQQKYFNAAVGYFELGMFGESESELNKIDACVAAQSVPVLELRLAISFARSDWNKMKIIARKLFLLDPSNPQWPFSDGYATAKIDSVMSKED
jgi:hypothetical protein